MTEVDVSSKPLTFICLTTSYQISEGSNFMSAFVEIHNWTMLAWGFANWWYRSWLELHDAVGLSYEWNSSHCTCNKWMVICIYCQRETVYFIKHCSTMLHVSVYTTTYRRKCTWFENKWTALKNMLEFARYRKCWHILTHFTFFLNYSYFC